MTLGTYTDTVVQPRRWLWWGGAWAFMTALAVVVHRMAWAPPDSLTAGLPALESGPIKPAANALDVVMGPVWAAMCIIVGDWGVYSLVQTVVAGAIASAIVLLLVQRLIGLRQRIAARLLPATNTLDAGRRRFLMEAPGTLVGIAAVGTAIPGAAVVPFDLRLRKYSVPMDGLASALVGLRIAFFADTHLGPRVPAAFITRAVREALALKPHLVLLGGDYVHAGSRYIGPAAALFQPIVDAGIPVVGVLGNHDWYNSRGLIATALKDMGIAMVDNGRVFLDAATRRLSRVASGEGLCIAGVGDLLTDTVDIDAALRDVPADMPRLVLSHNPDVAELSEVRSGPRIDLMLSGHTHGGQVALPLIGPLHVPSEHGSKYAGGLVQGPACRVLITRGVGMSICPIRLGVPPEIVEVTLMRA